MHGPHRRGARFGCRTGAVLVTITIALGACHSSGTPPRLEPYRAKAPVGAAPVDPTLRAAADRGALALRVLRDEMDPASLSIPAYLERRYGLTALAGSLAEARRLVAADLHRGNTSTTDGLVDPTAKRPVASQLDGSPTYERLIVATLYCSARDAEALIHRIETVAARGGYDLTHAAIAFELARQRGCLVPAVAKATRQRLVRHLTRAASSRGTVDDLAIERIAMFAFLGAPLPREAVQVIAGAQQADGRWMDPLGRVPAWHTTMLAVWVMAAASSRGNAVDFVADQPVSGTKKSEGRTGG